MHDRSSITGPQSVVNFDLRLYFPPLYSWNKAKLLDRGGTIGELSLGRELKRWRRPLKRGLKFPFFSTYMYISGFDYWPFNGGSTVRSKYSQNLLKTPQNTFYGGRERTKKNFPFYFLTWIKSLWFNSSKKRPDVKNRAGPNRCNKSFKRRKFIFLATFSTPSSLSSLLKLLIIEHMLEKKKEFLCYNYLFFFRYLYAAYLKGKKTTRSPTCCACCSWWCCKGGRGCAEVGCMQTDCTASCLQTCAACCPTRVPDITNFGVSQFSHKHPYVQKWYNVLQFTKGNIQWVFYFLSSWRKQPTENKRNRWWKEAFW